MNFRESSAYKVIPDLQTEKLQMLIQVMLSTFRMNAHLISSETLWRRYRERYRASDEQELIRSKANCSNGFVTNRFTHADIIWRSGCECFQMLRIHRGWSTWASCSGPLREKRRFIESLDSRPAEYSRKISTNFDILLHGLCKSMDLRSFYIKFSRVLFIKSKSSKWMAHCRDGIENSMNIQERQISAEYYPLNNI